MNTPVEFGEIGTSALAALVFEIASQLHAERSARLALQAAMLEKGLVSERDIERMGEDAQFRRHTCEAADDAVRRLIRTLSESSDERAPLRTDETSTCGPEERP